MTHIKGVIPTSHQHCTVRKSHKQEDEERGDLLRIVWTVDEDTEYAWRNLIETFDDSEFDQARLQRVCEALNFTPYPLGHPEYYDQFVGLRARLSVTVKLSGNYRTNVILEHLLPIQPAHIDVTKERSDDHYFHTKSKRSLPI